MIQHHVIFIELTLADNKKRHPAVCKQGGNKHHFLFGLCLALLRNVYHVLKNIVPMKRSKHSWPHDDYQQCRADQSLCAETES